MKTRNLRGIGAFSIASIASIALALPAKAGWQSEYKKYGCGYTSTNTETGAVDTDITYYGEWVYGRCNPVGIEFSYRGSYYSIEPIIDINSRSGYQFRYKNGATGIMGITEDFQNAMRLGGFPMNIINAPNRHVHGLWGHGIEPD